ncbi:DNA mismatch repair protein [Cymbomonas tetramitiformis]|uniref:DNA mismatch repair protein n=1 Tax=Cymbomonas tetramitiformis TaxID=36881 RepID=A0AAE0L3R0_9CHLO|nr:DNA mismatch repair protein [Cymbomonas tetramitiformis]
MSKIAPQVIQRLPEDVVNRIAAGEVIQRPSSALKELIENSLDAGSTSISVLVKEGGHKLLQVQDNGHGVREADLGILCERHTTSKLKSFEDLEGIGTLGFRGEALASISFVSHLTVTTMTPDAAHALKATYRDGVLDPEGASPCAGVKGTTISVEDLFYNVTTRKRALRSSSEEYSRILEVVGRYALLKTGVSFSCKKHSDKRLDVHTLCSNSRLDNIRAIFGPSVAKQLLPFEMNVKGFADASASVDTPAAADAMEEDDQVAFSVEGYVSSPNYGSKKTIFVLFINDRLVGCPLLERACKKVYEALLSKTEKPFIFFDLHLPAKHVDVNTHPTKQEVSFLHTEEVVNAIQSALEAKLITSNNSRTFYTQTRLPGAPEPSEEDHAGGEADPKQKQLAYKFVRTNSNNRAGGLDAYLRPAPSPCSQPDPDEDDPCTPGVDVTGERRASQPPPTQGDTQDAAEAGPSSKSQRASQRQRRSFPMCELTSVQELLAEVDKASSQDLVDMFRQHTYVGVADHRGLALMQYKTRLYLVRISSVCQELLYQQVLRRFQHFAIFSISNPPCVKELMLVMLDAQEAVGGWTPEDGSKEEISELARQLLIQKGPMMKEYFGITITDEGRLAALPVVLEHIVPDLERLPEFVHSLTQEVDWESEKECFQTAARVIAKFYSLEADLPCDAADIGSQESASEAVRKQRYEWNVQHVLFPAARIMLKPRARFATDGTLYQVACLEQLYKVFERC